MDRSRNTKALAYGALVLVVGTLTAVYLASGKTFDVQSLLSPPCDRPLNYGVGAFDERFGISRTDFDAALRDAARVWNEAAGKTIVEVGAENAIAVNLVYSQYQRNAQLGSAIDAEQQAYEDKRDEVEALRKTYAAERSGFAAKEATFERDSAAYDEQVDYWNARGGAPPAEYAQLQAEQRELAERQQSLNRLADEVNALVREMNTEVEELNRLAAQTNVKVGAYNTRAGTDFDQGTYTEDADGKRIDIYEFTNRTELKRVLAHEFGHALGLEHVENPESIMYSYNIGDTFALSQEDISALKEKCRLE